MTGGCGITNSGLAYRVNAAAAWVLGFDAVAGGAVLPSVVGVCVAAGDKHGCARTRT